ncbi:hypothetical protein CEXT_273911 [Caerostris extrusa]|uniref:Uncharacterized protein n=1 Tax=Caerostris extrusa TaxID=172846 RepID=A0AAV4NRK8_CAEEX|nr:hypothetical protein CEXT_273911 [Caerostris extrusa]
MLRQSIKYLSRSLSDVENHFLSQVLRADIRSCCYRQRSARHCIKSCESNALHSVTCMPSSPILQRGWIPGGIGHGRLALKPALQKSPAACILGEIRKPLVAPRDSMKTPTHGYNFKPETRNQHLLLLLKLEKQEVLDLAARGLIEIGIKRGPFRSRDLVGR